MANLQLIQPLGNVLARDQNNHSVDVTAAQLKVVTFGTKTLDSQSAEVCHVLLEPTDAKIAVPKLAVGVVGCIGCYIYLWLISVLKIQMKKGSWEGQLIQPTE